MWNESDRAWRAALWRHMLDMLPVEVLVNLGGRGFSMRRGGDASIYADDIDGEQYAQMLDEWSELLHCGARLRNGLCLRSLARRFAAGERAFGFQLPTGCGALSVSVHFRDAPELEPFVIRLERMDEG